MKSIFVANIDYRVTEATLELFLRQAGLKYLGLRLPPALSPNVNNRGFGFIHFANDADYAAAFAFLGGREFAGKLLRVFDAHPRKPRPAPVKYDAMRDVETRRTFTVSLGPDYHAAPIEPRDERIARDAALEELNKRARR